MAVLFDAFNQALNVVVQPENFLLIVIGTVIGLIMGIVPGLGGSIALALLIPLTFGMDALVAFMLFAAAKGGTNFGGSVSAILINTPGGGPNAATLLDGYPMTRQGRGSEAIGASAAASALGAIFGIIVLALSVPIMLDVVLLFGPPEIFWLGVWGLTIISVVVRGSLLLGILSAVLGLVFSMHGQMITGATRWTYGVSTLVSGFTLVPTLIGLFAVAEMINLVSKGQSIADTADLGESSNQWTGVREVLNHKSLLLRSSLIGAVIGMIPGVGGAAANFVAYFQAAQSSDDPEKFGTGDIRGVIASESSNDAKDGGAFIPTLALGIPGSAAMAVLLGAFVLHGITPGPLLLRDHLPIVAIVIVSLLISNVLTSSIGLALTKQLVYVTRIDVHLIAPVIIAVGLLGSYAASNNIADPFIALTFGILGFIMLRIGMPRVPMVLAFVLAPVVESNFFRSLYISSFDPTIFVESPISLGLILLTVLSLFLPLIRRTLDERGVIGV